MLYILSPESFTYSPVSHVARRNDPPLFFVRLNLLMIPAQPAPKNSFLAVMCTSQLPAPQESRLHSRGKLLHSHRALVCWVVHAFQTHFVMVLSLHMGSDTKKQDAGCAAFGVYSSKPRNHAVINYEQACEQYLELCIIRVDRRPQIRHA